MKIYVFGNYMDFKCLAGNCQTTCCSGWKIVVDREANERFKNLENKSLRADILSNIVEKDDVHSFKNRTNGDCAMLDGDGLCRIQRNSNEKILCNTCRKYPRLSFSDKETVLLSMAASCPVIIEYLSNDKIKNMWYEMGTDKKMYPVDISGVNWFAQDKNRFDILINDIKTKYYLKPERLSELFFDFADMAVDIIISCKDCMYFDGSFDAYEEQMQGEEFRRRYNDFTKKYGERLATFDKNYADYRIFTKKYENPDEDTYDRIYQVAGEIVMLDTIMFSLSLQKGSNYEKDIVNAVHWVYKTAVHGKVSGSKMHKKIMEILAK